MKPFPFIPTEHALKCSDVQDSISPYLDQRLTGQEMQAVQGHLQDCPLCAQECEDVWLAKSLLRSLAAKEPAPYLEARVLGRLHQPEMEETRPPRGRRLATAMAFSCLVVLTVAAPFAPSVHDSSPVLSSAMSELPETPLSQSQLSFQSIFSLPSPQEPNWTAGALTPARSTPKRFSLPQPLALSMPPSLPAAIQEQAHGVYLMRYVRGQHTAASFR